MPQRKKSLSEDSLKSDESLKEDMKDVGEDADFVVPSRKTSIIQNSEDE